MKTITHKFGLLLLGIMAICQTTFSQNYLKTPQEVQYELQSQLDNLFRNLDKFFDSFDNTLHNKCLL